MIRDGRKCTCFNESQAKGLLPLSIILSTLIFLKSLRKSILVFMITCFLIYLRLVKSEKATEKKVHCILSGKQITSYVSMDRILFLP